MKCDYKYCIYYDNETCTNKNVELRGTTCATCKVIFLADPPKNNQIKPKNKKKTLGENLL
ncbi:MAG: hypothetical protein FWC89_10525 [Defluviitaleaceae bacterium]|nr:hypothetical protein [Defluviitaleaceae bacterium]